MGYKENIIKNIKKLQKEQEVKERLVHYKQAKYLFKNLSLKSLKDWEIDLYLEIHNLEGDLKQMEEAKNK